MHRFAEAAKTLERAVSIAGVHEGSLNLAASYLVRAYYALGQDVKAENLIRQLYPADQIPQVIKSSKAAAAKLKTAR